MHGMNTEEISMAQTQGPFPKLDVFLRLRFSTNKKYPPTRSFGRNSPTENYDPRTNNLGLSWFTNMVI